MASDLADIVRTLRTELEGPLKEAEKKLLNEKSLLLLVYEGLTGRSSVDARVSDLTYPYTIGFLSDYLPELSQTISTESSE